MSCPGRRVRSQSPDTFPADTGPINPPARCRRGRGAQTPRRLLGSQLLPCGASKAVLPHRPTRSGARRRLTVSMCARGDLQFPCPTQIPATATMLRLGGGQDQSWGRGKAW